MDLLNKNEINNIDKIINVINTDKNFEHIGDIIALLDKYDKKRKLNSLELKKAVFTIIKLIIEDLNFVAVKSYKNRIDFYNLDDIFEYLEQNWFTSDIREYLLFFRKLD